MKSLAQFGFFFGPSSNCFRREKR